MKFRNKRSRSGFTLIEMVFVSAISLSVFLVGMTAFLLGLSSWYNGEVHIETQDNSEQAVRTIALTLREAMAVTVDANGQGLSFRLPSTDGSGTFLNPPVWDGINRRIALIGTNVVIQADNQPDRTVASNVITTDPNSPGGATAYKLFTPGAGTVTRSLTVLLVTQGTRPGTNVSIYGRHREDIYLRNIPQLTQ